MDDRKRYVCIEEKCNTKVWDKNTRCFSCYTVFKKGINNPNYKHGKCLIESYCIYCNKKLCSDAYYNGYTSCGSCHRKNKKHSEDHKLKIKNSIIEKWKDISFRIKTIEGLLLHYKNPQVRQTISNRNSGINNPNYIDGRTDIRKSIRHIFNSKEWRTACFKRDNYTCQDCGQVGGTLNVDHIKPFSIIIDKFLNKYKELCPVKDKEKLISLAIKYKPFWDINNGRTLCKKCHIIKTKEDWKMNKFVLKRS